MQVERKNRKPSTMKFIAMRREDEEINQTDYVYKKYGSEAFGSGDRPEREAHVRTVEGQQRGERTTSGTTRKKPSVTSFKPKNAKE